MKIFLLWLALFVALAAFAQHNTEDVIYLRNGSIIRGKLLTSTLIDTSKISIELTGGSVFVFQKQEIDSAKKENAFKRQVAEIKKNYFRRDRGFRNQTEFGIIYGTNLKHENSEPYYYNVQGDDFGISLHTVNGYQIWPYLFVGAGVGIDRMVSYRQTFSPLYIRVASEFIKKKISPYIFADAGYSVMWKQKNDDYYSYQNKGGYYVSCGGGLRIYTRSRASVVLAVAYKRNYSETKWWYTQWNEGTYYQIKRTYQRLVVNVGVTF